MKRWLGVLTMAMLPMGAFLSAQSVDDELLKKYWDEEKGKLTSALEVRNEKKGFGIFFGTFWRLEAGGQWKVTRVHRNIPKVIAEGTLKKEELKELALTIAQYDPLTLPNVGRPLVNPHVVSVSFGGKQSYMTFGVDQVLPNVKVSTPKVKKSPASNPYVPKTTPVKKTVDPSARFAGIQSAIRQAIESNRGSPIPPPDLPRVGGPGT